GHEDADDGELGGGGRGLAGKLLDGAGGGVQADAEHRGERRRSQRGAEFRRHRLLLAYVQEESGGRVGIDRGVGGGVVGERDVGRQARQGLAENLLLVRGQGGAEPGQERLGQYARQRRERLGVVHGTAGVDRVGVDRAPVQRAGVGVGRRGR